MTAPRPAGFRCTKGSCVKWNEVVLVDGSQERALEQLKSDQEWQIAGSNRVPLPVPDLQ